MAFSSLGNSLNIGPLTGGSRSLSLPAALRDKHLYITGATGTGKSKLLEHLIRQDIVANRASGCGMLVIDPHGSLYDSLMTWLTFTNLQRPVIPIDMREADWVVAYNVLRKRIQANPSVIVENFVQAMAHVWGQTGTDQTPLFARWAGNTLRALYEKEYTLADAMHLLTDRAHVRAAMTSGINEPITRRDWDMANALKPKEFEDQIGSTVNRLRRFLTNDVLRCVFGQTSASLDLGAALDNGSIVLVSLAREKGRVSKEDSELFATLLLTDLWTVAQERGKRGGIKPFYVYLDEFQRFVTPTIAENLDEARGFGLHLTLAHQFPKQLLNAGEHGKRVYDSVMENASSKIVFRLTDPENLEPLAHSLFMGVMDPDQIKHKLHSTKVMGYSEEIRTTHSRSTSKSTGYAEHESNSCGAASGEGETFDDESELRGSSSSRSEYAAGSSGWARASQEGNTEGESEVPILIPVMGNELSHVQFRSLDEQVHQAMAALFDQKERHFTARLAGMKAPVSLRTPEVTESLVYPWRVRKYLDERLKRLPFALSTTEAMKQLKAREAQFAEQGGTGGSSSAEPTTSRRVIRTKP
jgi:hypothetical protein